MKKNLSLSAIWMLLSCLLINGAATAQRNQPNRQTNITYKIIEAPNKTFGYDIYSNEHKMIHQSSVPGLPGNEGFKTKVATQKVAQLVITKIKNGDMPPTVTIEEMKKLKVISFKCPLGNLEAKN